MNTWLFKKGLRYTRCDSSDQDENKSSEKKNHIMIKWHKCEKKEATMTFGCHNLNAKSQIPHMTFDGENESEKESTGRK